MNRTFGRGLLVIVGVAGVLLLVVVLVVRAGRWAAEAPGAPGGPRPGDARATPAPGTARRAAEGARAASERLQAAVDADGIRAHLVALERAALANGGNRAAGTAGYDASVRYVTGQLRAAGYRPILDPVEIPETGARTVNVIAETAGGGDRVVMVGAHLDGVRAGPGINDNGSGAALLLELARALAAGPAPASKVRFAWWGAEEIGLVGSGHYVRGLSDGEARRIAAYLNFDMIGSRNYARFVYDADGLPAGSARIQRLFERHFAERGLATEEIDIVDASDHGPFASRGIPVGGLYSGAGERRRGGRADPCYHRACDDLDNIDEVAVDELADGAAHVLATLAASSAAPGAAREP